MANTYELIASTSLGSAQNAVTLSNIPASYTDLVLKISGRSSTGGGITGTLGTNIATSTYSETWLYTGGTTISNNQQGAATTVNPGFSQDPSSTSNIFANCEIYISSYAASNWISFGSTSVNPTYNTVGSAYIFLQSYTINTTTNISSITCTIPSFSWAANSSFWLYGIKRN